MADYTNENGFANLAFMDQTPDITQLNQSKVIDLTATKYEIIEINNFPSLRRLRLCQCRSLKKISIANCPNLEVVDLSNCKLLSIINFENLPKILSIDLSSTNVTSFDFELPKLESLLLLNTQITNFSNLKNRFGNLLNLDISNCKVNDLSFLMNLNSLFRFKFLNSPFDTLFDLNLLSTHPKLSTLIIGPGNVKCDSISSSTSLHRLIFNQIEFISGNENDLRHFQFNDKYSYDVPEISSDFPPWANSVRLLYGPWGIPKCDIIDQKNEIVMKNKIPKNFNQEVAVDHMLGAIYGAALGSILGLSTEFTSRSYASFILETPLDIIWSHSNEDATSIERLKGTVTPEIEQSVLLMRALSSSGPDKIKEFAQSLEEWASDGISEHRQGGCLCFPTSLANTIRHPFFHDDPKRAAFETSSEFAADGMATARAATAACFRFWEEAAVKRNARKYCCTTHFEPRSIASTLIVALLIAKNIQKASKILSDTNESISVNKNTTNDNQNAANNNGDANSCKDGDVERVYGEIDIDQIVEEALEFDRDSVVEFEDEIRAFMSAESFEELVLGDGTPDYVLKAAGAAVLVARKKMSFEDAIGEVIRCGGDTDTNAAVAGAVVGSAVGFSKIPEELLKYVYSGNWIFNDFAKLLMKMGIDPPKSPFLDLSYR